MTEQVEQDLPYYLTVGYRSPLGPYQQEVEESARSTHRIIDHIFGDKRSYLDPAYTIWDAETAQKAQDFILQAPWQNGDDPFNEVPKALAEAGISAKPVALFLAETYLLRNIQMDAITAETGCARIRYILEAVYAPEQVETILAEKQVEYLLERTLYSGGQQANFHPSMTFIWMAQLCIGLADYPRVHELTEDPWALKEYLGQFYEKALDLYVQRALTSGQPMKRKPVYDAHARPFRIAVFPNVFEPINVAGNQQRINNYLLRELKIEDTGDIDKNLLEARRYIETSHDETNPGLVDIQNFLRDTPSGRGDFVFGQDRVILYDGLMPLWNPPASPSTPSSSTEQTASLPKLPSQGLTMLESLDQDYITEKINAPRTGEDGKNWVADMLSALENRKQIIFYGPPGTGKTYVAQAIVESYTPNDGDADGFNHEDSYELVQFHPSYTYEDFFEGYRPASTASAPGQASGLSFTLKPGPLKRLADRARQNPDRPYFLIIDEINRGNIAKIFGELYYLLEYRDKQMTLQYSDEPFTLPANIFIIGTMNTVDRSIATVDAAIRRRFAFIELSPRTEPTRGVLARAGEYGAALQNELNDRLAKQGTDLAIGPSYFFNLTSQQAIEQVWNYDILPLLVDHFYGIKTADEVEDEFALTTFLQAEDEDVDNTSDSHQEFGEESETSDREDNQ